MATANRPCRAEARPTTPCNPKDPPCPCANSTPSPPASCSASSWPCSSRPAAPYVAWLGQIFISVLKLLILPLILVSIYASLAGGDNLRRIGGRTFLYYIADLRRSRHHRHPDRPGLRPTTCPQACSTWSRRTAPASKFSLDRLIDNFIPSNLFASLAEGNVLHIVFVAVVAAAASRRIAKHHRTTLLGGAQALDALLMQILNGVLALAPVGIAALVYASLASMDWAGVFQLRSFVWAVALAAVLHAAMVMPTLYRVRTGRSPWRFVAACREPLLTALSTASSNATYPVSKRALEDFGVSERVTSLTLPLGATLNMHGSALYQSILLIFMSHLAGADVESLHRPSSSSCSPWPRPPAPPASPAAASP